MKRLTSSQALAAYTTGGAAAGPSAVKWSLNPGTLAEFTVLSGSPLTAARITDVRVLATAVGGSFTCQADAPAAGLAATSPITSVPTTTVHRGTS